MLLHNNLSQHFSSLLLTQQYFYNTVLHHNTLQYFSLIVLHNNSPQRSTITHQQFSKMPFPYTNTIPVTSSSTPLHFSVLTHGSMSFKWLLPFHYQFVQANLSINTSVTCQEILMNSLSLYIYVKLIKKQRDNSIHCSVVVHTHTADTNPASANQYATLDLLSISLLVPTRLVLFSRSSSNAYGSQLPTPLVLLLKNQPILPWVPCRGQ